MDWADIVRRQINAGRTMERVRVIDDDETGYQQWAEWSAGYNRAGGELIHRVRRSQADARGLHYEPAEFWLLDDKLVISLSFEPTDRPANVSESEAVALGLDAGLYRLAFIELIDDDETLARARQVRDRAMSLTQETTPNECVTKPSGRG